jgi:hypothetical protein
MDAEPDDRNWKLKLRYGRLKTPFQHFTVIAEGVAGDLMDGFSCRPGSTFMSMKVWASSSEESIEMIRAIGKQIGFTVTGRTYVYETEPTSPPKANPHGYEIKFTSFDSK